MSSKTSRLMDAAFKGNNLAIAAEDGGEFVLDDSTKHGFGTLQEAIAKISEILLYQAVLKVKGNIAKELM